MATAKAKPTDATGRQREKLIQENAEAVQAEAETAAEAEAAVKNAIETDVIDATAPNKAAVIVDAPIVVDATDEAITIRVIETIENMTFGAGNFYTFEAGKKYQVTRDLARHLEEKGYLAGSF